MGFLRRVDVGGRRREGMGVEKEKRVQWTGHSAHLGVALKGAHLAFDHRAVLLTITESLF